MERSLPPRIEQPAYPEVAQAFHIANFVPANWGAQDPISRSLVAFHHAIEPDTTQWIRLVLQGIAGIPAATLIVRALSSDELTSGNPTPLDRLGRELGARMGAAYEPFRLSKVRATRAVKNAGARHIRDRLLEGAYLFDPAGLDDAPTVLIIDDCVTTGATFAAIAGAIKAGLPGAGVRYLALGRTDPWLVRLHLGEEYSGSEEAYRESLVGNRHLDERYFTGAAPAAERRRHQGRIAAGEPLRVFGEEESAEAPAEPEPERRPPPPGAPLPTAAPSAGAPAQPVSGRLVTILIGVAGLLTLAVTVFVLTQRDPRGDYLASPPEPEPVTFTPPREEARPRESPPVRAERRIYGTVNVPSVGLRSTPSISSLPIENAIVTAGERVVLIRTFRGESGPDWVFIQTARGTRGWVIAAVVTRSR